MKISKEAMRLIDSVAEEAFLNGAEHSGFEPSADYEKARNDLEAYVSELEAKLPKWKTGHPEHKNKVLIRVQGVLRDWYDTDYWSPEEGWWWGYPVGLEQGERIIGWCEIPEYDIPDVDKEVQE